VKIKMGYGICDLGGSLYFTVIAFWLLIFFTDTVGISAGLAGIIVMIGKVWDAITDPIVGYISDRTNSRWGRRKPYILFGSVPMFFGMTILFTNPHLDSQALLFIWGVAVFCLMNTVFTIVNIPYSSLTPDLTQDFHERSSLNGYRFVFAVVGTLFSAGLALPIVEAMPDRNLGFTVMGAFFGAVMMVVALITYFTVPEPKKSSLEQQRGFLSTFTSVFKNKPYILILLTHAVQVTAITVFSGIVAYNFKYIHGAESKTTIGLLILLVTAMLFIPINVLISKKIGKKLSYGTGLLIIAFMTMLLFFFGHTKDVTFTFIMLFLCGIGLGFIYATPWAIVPDTIEYDYLKTGERKEGAYYGIWTFITKLGQALAIGITGWVLSLSGYVPDVVQTDTAVFGIRLLVGPIPSAIFIIAAVILYFYPINEEKYKEILKQIKKKEESAAVTS